MKGEDMGARFDRLRWGCIFLLLFFMVGCSLQGPRKPEGEKEFSHETHRLKKRARENPEASIRAESHLLLAFLYLNHKNPQLSYNRALQEMESYLSFAPAEEQTDDFHNWFAVLKEVGKLRTSLETAQKANKALRDEVAGLKEMNNKMRETIEKLKSLDRQMEEKRNLTK
jgi:hypothetical protein